MSQQTQNMFSSISATYDKLNHVLSFGWDRVWRKKTIAQIDFSAHDSFTVLDLCAGTCDLSLECVKQFPKATITAADFSDDMLALAQKKIKKANQQKAISLVPADALNLSFKKDSFDVLLCGFGVRNFDDIAKGVKEMHRVLKPGGQLIILEFFKSATTVGLLFHKTYASTVIPVVGKLVSGHSEAYSYLKNSIENFLTESAFCGLLNHAGFESVATHQHILHVATTVTAKKCRK